ncbi:MAG: MBL fold metallo-hydrolase [Pseudomonadales bacterium]|nr:MBL fold metallo-hydrolase [Pseudomonadales bacterium]
MQTHNIYNGKHQWLVFGRDEDKPDKIIDTNQCMVINGNRSLLIDPGGTELFAPMLAVVLQHLKIEEITDLFASHQDPDIISSLGLWDQVLPNATLHASWIWEGFIRHFGMNNIPYSAIPDVGGILHLGDVELQLVPAHYLHSSGNFNIYDPAAKILFSGDIGASLEGPGSPMYVEDFEIQKEFMTNFHQRWMPSNEAKLDWIKRVRALDIELMVPQHGRIFRGDDIPKFLDWFEELKVGVLG